MNIKEYEMSIVKHSVKDIGVWFPTVRTNSGTDVFTERLVEGLIKSGIRAEITWLPYYAEYLPWLVPIPDPPTWANIAHINTWLHPRFIPKNLPIVATLHHSIHDPALKAYKGWLRAAYHHYWIKPIERNTIQQAHTVVGVSQFAAESAFQQLCNRSIQVIHNGVNIRRFHCPTDRKPHQPFRLLYVGSWMTRKGVDLLAPIMRELGNDFVLHFTGGAQSEKDKPKMPENMHDLGRLSSDATVAAMQEADALLFPSRSEGFGLVLVEAMACGLPVITTRASCLTEIVLDQETGILCRLDNISSFVLAARYIADNNLTYYKFSKNAQKHAKDNFSQEIFERKYIEVYRQVIMSDIN